MAKSSLVIGISMGFFPPDPERNLFKNKRLIYLEQSLVNWTCSLGAAVVALPFSENLQDLKTLVGLLDGLILSGGDDVSAASYNSTHIDPRWPGDEYRDKYELNLIRYSLEKDLPVLGICRGCQLLNVAYGGSLCQDISTYRKNSIEHRNWALYEQNSHAIEIQKDSKLYQSLKTTTGNVNSVHHQAVEDLGRGLRVSARCLDGTIEGIESENENFVVGVQWHPEWTALGNGLIADKAIGEAFMQAARMRKR